MGPEYGKGSKLGHLKFIMRVHMYEDRLYLRGMKVLVGGARGVVGSDSPYFAQSRNVIVVFLVIKVC